MIVLFRRTIVITEDIILLFYEKNTTQKKEIQGSSMSYIKIIILYNNINDKNEPI